MDAAPQLSRARWRPTPGYDFGYVLGAVCADATVGPRSVSLVVNDDEYAKKFAESLCRSFGIDAALEPVERPSGYLGRPVAGFRVRVVSSYLADLFRQYVGGDAHHQRQRFPRVVLRDEATFAGFLDGYVDGDGGPQATSPGRTVVSANVRFLADLSQ